MRLDFTVGEPAEGDDFELAAIFGVGGAEFVVAALGGCIGWIHVFGNALHDGFAVGSGNQIPLGIRATSFWY